MPQSEVPALYGLSADNSSRTGKDLWGKNQFNSTFPLSLCLFMRDQGILPIGVIARDGGIETDNDIWHMRDVVGSETDNTFYHFEETVALYTGLSRNANDHIDLIVAIDEQHKIPLEVKLTVVPDSHTADKNESEWAPEIVVRPVTSAHAMMGIATSLQVCGDKEIRVKAQEALREVYNRISDWDNISEVIQHSADLHSALDSFSQIVTPLQRPYLMQPIWRTKGQSLKLCDQCLDVFVWSDVAVLRLPVEEHAREKAGNGMNRFLRAIAVMFARCMKFCRKAITTMLISTRAWHSACKLTRILRCQVAGPFATCAMRDYGPQYCATTCCVRLF